MIADNNTCKASYLSKKTPHLIVFHEKNVASLLVIALISFIGVWNFANDPFASDCAVFEYVGRVIVKGGIPYVDAWDHKGPIIHFYAALGRLLTPLSSIGGTLLCAITAAVSLTILYIACLKLFRPIHAALIIYLTAYIYIQGMGTFHWLACAALYVTYTCLTIYCIVKYFYGDKKTLYLFTLGFLLSLGIITKANYAGIGCFGCSLFVLEALRTKEYKVFFKRVFVYSVGAATCTLLVGIASVCYGVFTEMIDAAILYNVKEYEISNGYFSSFNTARVIPEKIYDSAILRLAYTQLMAVVAYARYNPTLTLMVFLSLCQQIRYVTRENFTQKSSFIIAAWCWLAFEFMSAGVKPAIFSHYYSVTAVPMALVLGFSLDLIARQGKSTCGVLLALGILCACLTAYDESRELNKRITPFILNSDTIQKLDVKGKTLATYGGIFACRNLNNMNAYAENRFCINRYMLSHAISDVRKRAVEADFHQALLNCSSSLLLSEKEIKELPFESAEVRGILDNCETVYNNGKIYVYRINR